MATQRQELATQQFSFVPTTLKEAVEYATIFANSGLCPEAYKGRPNDILMCWQMGQEMGLDKMQSLRSIYCVNGTPSTYGDGQFALVKKHRDFEDAKEWLEGDIKSGTLTAYCTLTRKGHSPQTRKFGMEDAKLAGLWDKKDNWKKYPGRMLQHRARTYCCRDVFPEATFGLPTQDEAEEIVRVQPLSKPKNKGMSGLEEAMGLSEESENIVDATFEVVEPEPVSPQVDALTEELLSLFIEKNVPEKSIHKWCAQFSVDVPENIPAEGKEKIINYLKEKV